MVVLHHSNNWDNPTDIYLTEHGLRELHRERKVRPYTKVNAEYKNWGSKIEENRKKRRRISTEAGNQCKVTTVTVIEDMSVAQLKKEL